MQWQDVCDDKLLQDLPYKVELNQWGQIVMSPAKIKHGFYQSKIAYLLESLSTGGEAMIECAIQTSDNVKVADVAWASDERADIIIEEVSASIAPEICVEVVSASNTTAEMEFKKTLYFQAGAQEVWICNRHGHLTFFNQEQQLKTSNLIPDFPLQMKRRNQK